MSHGLRHINAIFPNIGDYSVESPRSAAYNCIAWAGGDSQRFWWPDADGKAYWPSSVPREPTVDAFLEAFRGIGYEQCDDGAPEDGVEKIAIYSTRAGEPTHAARQLESGKWTSKLGLAEDIEHERPEGLEGSKYGTVHTYMGRPRPE